MCLTQNLIHTHCRHTKKSETFACLAGLSASGTCQENDRLPFTSQLLADPGYCQECRLEVEQQICLNFDAYAQDLHVDIMHLKELFEITVEKHENEMREYVDRLKGMGKEDRKEGEDARDVIARIGREQRRMGALRRRHEDLEMELKRWLDEAQEKSKVNQEGKDRALKDFRVAEGAA